MKAAWTSWSGIAVPMALMKAVGRKDSEGTDGFELSRV
jgi:hypothetical protein